MRRRKQDSATSSGVISRAALGLVLVVEDDADDREVLCDLFAEHGFDVLAAADVGGAIAHLATCVPDVVVSDLQLAHRSRGVDLARHVRTTPELSHIGLIAMSGAVEPNWPTVRCFDAYLRKPLDADDLIDLVSRLAAASHGFRGQPVYVPADRPFARRVTREGGRGAS
ncbi:MAG: response regulator [Myxococcota bacterium]|nr:response regulator [Myxococcota bacterium]